MNKALFTGFAFFTIISLVVASPPTQAETYSYDNLGRLASVTYDDNTTINYTYDANGNVLAIAASTVAQGGGSTTNQNTNTTTQNGGSTQNGGGTNSSSGGSGGGGGSFDAGLLSILLIALLYPWRGRRKNPFLSERPIRPRPSPASILILGGLSLLMSAPASACIKVGGTVHFIYHGFGTMTIECLDSNLSTVTIPSTSELEVTPNTATDVTATNKATFTIYHIGASYGTLTLSGTYSGLDWPAGENPFSPMLSVTVDPPNPSGDSTANHPSSGTMPDDPVDSYTGELYTTYAPDLYLGGPLPLYFSRYYGTMIGQDGNISSALGTNWLHNFDMTMIQTTGAETVATIVTNRGRVINFQQNGASWDLLGSPDIPFQLVDGGGGNFIFGDPRHERQYTFNASGQLTQIADGHGNVQTLTYSSGKLTTVSDGLGRTLSFAYNGSNQLTSVSDNGSPSSRSATFGYTGSNLTSVTDARGNTTAYSYDTGGLMLSSTRPELNSPYTQTFDGQGRVATQADALANTYSMAYNGSDTTMTDPLSNTRTHTHSANGELTAAQDESGNSLQMTYDANGRRTGITDRLGDSTTYTYHSGSGKLASVTHADGTQTQYSYTARATNGLTFYDLTQVTHADNTTDSYTYTSGNMTRHTDRAGKHHDYTYNGNGQVLTATNPAGGMTTYTYDANGNLKTTTDPSGNTTTYAYDSYQRLVTVTHADASTRQFTYDDNDNLLTDTDENGNVTTYTYDKNNNLSTIQDAQNQTTTFVYDGMDRLQSVQDPLGNSVSFTTDTLGRLATLTDKAGNVTQYGYDARGRLTTTTDAAAKQWQRGYDLESIAASSSDPLSNSTTFTSDTMGRITRVTDPLANATDLGYDSVGRLTAVTGPLGNSVSLGYDARGLSTQITLPESISASYTRDDLGLVTQANDPLGNAWQLAYDNQGRLTGRTDPLSRQTTYGYDNRNRLNQVTYPNSSGTLGLTYDANGNPTRRLYQVGSTTDTDLTYSYDSLNRLTGANQSGTANLSLGYDENGQVTASNGITFTRNLAGRIATATYATGKTVTYTYNSRNLLSRVSDWNGDNTDFAYDDAGRLITITRPNGIITTYTYDANSNVTGISEGSVSSISLTRNAAGLITSATRNLPQAGTATNLSDLSQSVDSANQISGNSYDDQGRRTADADRSYTWDLAGRLTGLSEGSATTSYTYDALGMRIGKSDGSTTNHYVWDYATGLPSVAIERDGGDNDQSYYITTPGGALLYSIDADSGTRSDYHFDERGNTVFLSDSGGAVTDSYAYTPFGQAIAKSGSTANPFTWQGEYQVMDEGDGLYYTRARYYDSASRRFISKDPVRSLTPLAINPYQYAYNNPISLYDATGSAPDEATPANQNGGSQFHLFVDTSLDDFAFKQAPTAYGPDYFPSPGIASFSNFDYIINHLSSDHIYWFGRWDIRHRHVKTRKTGRSIKNNCCDLPLNFGISGYSGGLTFDSPPPQVVHRHGKTRKLCAQSNSNYRYRGVRPPDSGNLGLGYSDDLKHGAWYCVGFYYTFENSSADKPLHHDTGHISGSARETVRGKGIPSPKPPTPTDDSDSAIDESSPVNPLS